MNKIFLFFFFSLCSCTSMDSPEEAAKDYCECLRKHDSPKNNVIATRICDAELINKNYFFRLDKIDIPYERYGIKPIPESTKDSVWEYMNEFDKYLLKNCCNEIHRCNSGVQNMSLDSLEKLRKHYPDSDFSGNKYIPQF